jgi:hypothetical protein
MSNELFVGIVTVVCLSGSLLMYMFYTAPIGYQDEHGFHYGEPPEKDG